MSQKVCAFLFQIFALSRFFKLRPENIRRNTAIGKYWLTKGSNFDITTTSKKKPSKTLQKPQTLAQTQTKSYRLQACWCKLNNKNKTQAIKEQEAHLLQLANLIEEGVASSARLKVEIENLGKEIETNTASLEAAVALRAKQSEEFHAEVLMVKLECWSPMCFL